MERSFATLALAVMLVLGPITATAIHAPGQDDAGTGSDAGDADALATPVEPGTYTGELAAKLDQTDVYQVDSDDAEILRVDFTSGTELDVSLVGPDGTVRDTNGPFDPTQAELSAITRPAGEWLIRFEAPTDTSLDTDLPYAFEVRLEQHEHVARLDAPDGAVPAFRADVSNESFVRFELYPSPVRSQGTDGEGIAEQLRIRFDQGFAFARTSVGIASEPVNNPHVRTDGQLPAGANVEVTPAVDPAGFAVGRLAIETEAIGYNMSHGLAWNRGVQQDGWLAWDGPRPDVTWLDGGTSAFLQTDDMNATGPTVRVGPYVTSEGLAAEATIPDATNVVVLNAWTPPANREEMRMEVRRPDGTVLTPRDEVRFLVDGFAPVPGGTWNVTIDHVDGLERSEVRFMAVSFPFPSFSEV